MCRVFILNNGSANVIGGQDAVIKLKYGEPASKLLIADAPRGVKFALGENVKRTDGRFPNTRLGVEALLVRAFSEAQAYRRQWQDYQRAKPKSAFADTAGREAQYLQSLERERHNEKHKGTSHFFVTVLMHQRDRQIALRTRE